MHFPRRALCLLAAAAAPGAAAFDVWSLVPSLPPPDAFDLPSPPSAFDFWSVVPALPSWPFESEEPPPASGPETAPGSGGASPVVGSQPAAGGLQDLAGSLLVHGAPYLSVAWCPTGSCLRLLPHDADFDGPASRLVECWDADATYSPVEEVWTASSEPSAAVPAGWGVAEACAEPQASVPMPGGWFAQPASAFGPGSEPDRLARFGFEHLVTSVCPASNSLGCASLQGAAYQGLQSASSQVVSGINWELVATTTAGTLTMRLWEQAWAEQLELTEAHLSSPVGGASFAISEYDVITSPEPLSYAAYASFLLSEPRPSRRSLSAPAGVAAAGAAAAALFVAAAAASSRRSNFGRRQRDDAPALV